MAGASTAGASRNGPRDSLMMYPSPHGAEPIRFFCRRSCISPRSPRPGRALALGVLHGEADLQQHLIEMDLAVLDLAARLHHFEPAQIAHRLGGAADGG